MAQAKQIVTIALVFETALVVLAAVIGMVIGRAPWDQLTFDWRAAAGGVVGTLPLVLGLAWCLNSNWPPFRRLVDTVEDTLVPLFAECSVGDILVISIAAGVGEEVLFRGLIQPSLSAVIGPLLGLTVTSVLFGLLHLVTPSYAVMAGLMGAYLGVLVLASGNLMLAIVAHALYDFVALWRLTQWRSRLRHEI